VARIDITRPLSQIHDGRYRTTTTPSPPRTKLLV